MNLCLHSGRLTKTPVITTQNGVAKTSFTVACRRNYKNKQGEYDTDFIFFQAYRRTAEYITTYLNQGDFIEIQSTMRCVNYEKNGVKEFYRFLDCTHVQLVAHPQNKSEKSRTYDNIPPENEPDIEFNFYDESEN